MLYDLYYMYNNQELYNATYIERVHSLQTKPHQLVVAFINNNKVSYLRRVQCPHTITLLPRAERAM